MPDGHRADPHDDGVEQAALAAEARLIRRVRWRLVAWSGVSTLLVLVVLGVALYVAVASTLETASVQQLSARAAPLVDALEGSTTPPEQPPLGFLFGSGNTFLFAFDDQGRPIQFGRGQAIVPDGLPEAAGLAAARTAPGATDVRTATLQVGIAPVTAVPIRVLTRRLVAVQDGNTYFLQVLQDRSTEVGTLDALLAVLLAGGALVVIVAFGFGTVYARRALVPIRESLAGQRDALRHQREFAADASHELRTPLTVIRSSVEHLARHRDRPIGESSEALDDIDAEVSRLALLVDDLLLLARSDSGAVSMEMTRLDLADVALDGATSLGRAAEGRGITIDVRPQAAIVDGDPARLRQLVMILVDNAIRHAPRGSAVEVTITASGGTATLEVADRGPGVREEDMPHVFDRFWRAPGAPTGGTGLGLAIAKWIVDRHAGRIGVGGRDGGGAVFRAELPLAVRDGRPG